MSGITLELAGEQYDVAPRLLRGSAPTYPITRILADEDGSATVSFAISEDGTTKDIKVVSATYEYFGRHSAAAIKKWLFAPAIKDGKAVAVRTTVELQFKLK